MEAAVGKQEVVVAEWPCRCWDCHLALGQEYRRDCRLAFDIGHDPVRCQTCARAMMTEYAYSPYEAYFVV